MGEKMTSKNLAFVSIEPINNRFTAFLSVEDILLLDKDPELLLENAAEIYEQSVITMRSLIDEIQNYKVHRKPIPAYIIWKLGDTIFQLMNKLESLSIQLDNIYGHLIRDLGVDKELLKRSVTFRRYLPKGDLVPESLNWRRCRKGIRKIAERLREGLPPD